MTPLTLSSWRLEVVTRERAKPGPPTLWSTALGPDRVYYTKVYRGGKSEILSTDR